MRLSVIGAGNLGRAVGSAWQRAGHEVVYGVRDPGRHDRSDVTSIPAALAGAAAVLVAVPGAALRDLLSDHAADLDGALVLDATNAVGAEHLHQYPLYAEFVSTARVFRAFNAVGAEVIAEPVIEGDRADLCWCGPDGADRLTVERLIADTGLRPVYLGDVTVADVLDGVSRLWFALAFGQGYGRHHGLRLLQRSNGSR
jgi:predicted dinucleotide-binding enzyme